jgi:amino acid transporter
MVYAGVLASHALINHYGIKIVSWLNNFSVTVHIVGVFVIVGALFFFAPKQPASFFFERVTHNTEGWPYWWAFIIGLLQALWTFTGYDASASVSEETVDPRRRAPWGMVMAVAVSGIVGYLLLFALTISIQDIEVVLNAKDASGADVPAVLTILVTALGEQAGTLFSALAAMAMWFCGLSAVTWSSRVIWAFARDAGLPLSKVWRHISPKHSTPVPAIWLCVTAALVAALYSGAYAVVTSISTIGLYISYIIPVYLMWRTRGTERELARGPWHLGRYGGMINLISIIWVVFLCIILSIPDDMRTGKSILAVAVLLTLWYLFYERRRFRGPIWSASDKGVLSTVDEAAIDSQDPSTIGKNSSESDRT